ncbi:MAG: hypothetical protein WBG46_05625 [Nonlabens sp.]
MGTFSKEVFNLIDGPAENWVTLFYKLPLYLKVNRRVKYVNDYRAIYKEGYYGTFKSSIQCYASDSDMNNIASNKHKGGI